MIGRLSIVRRMPFGVELVARDLSSPLSQDESAALRALFFEQGLVLFRSQQLTVDEQIDVLECIGPVLRASDGVGYISTQIDKGALGSSELVYHSDLDFWPKPYTALSLLAIDVPAGATSTRYASNARAYDQLPAGLRDHLQRLRLVTAFPVDYGQSNVGADIPAEYPRVSRPPIVAHPETGRQLLMVSQQAVRFEGLSDTESKALLGTLHDVLYDPANVYEHYWHNGDFVIWDNFAFQHARSPLIASGVRTLQRVVVAEDSFADVARELGVAGR